MKKPKTYMIPFKKTVWGFSQVIAFSKKEALEKLGTDDDEYDNKSDYKYDFKRMEIRK